jgi:hypothetical protein
MVWELKIIPGERNVPPKQLSSNHFWFKELIKFARIHQIQRRRIKKRMN